LSAVAGGVLSLFPPPSLAARSLEKEEEEEEEEVAELVLKCRRALGRLKLCRLRLAVAKAETVSTEASCCEG
jgi:hypothetical protein